MNLVIKKIRLGELESFMNSKAFGELETIPITPLRINSYLANPNAQKDDIVLYLGYANKKMVAFRSLFADVIHTGEKHIRFAWCSGAWVHESYRNNGYSLQLLKQACLDWGDLMFTNYTLSSEKLIVKSGLFVPVHQFEGARAYLYPQTRKLWTVASKNRLFWAIFSISDYLIHIFSTILTTFYSTPQFSKFQFTELELPDKHCYALLSSKKQPSSYDQEKLDWIFNHQWISGLRKDQQENYPFSSFSEAFYYRTIKVFSASQFLGFFIFSVREGHLKTLFWNLPAGIEKEISDFIIDYCVKNKIEYITVYKTGIATELIQRKFPFLHVKKYGQKIYSTFDLEDDIEIEFQDCTGDVVFT